jgi:hypothetical protein
MDVPIQELDIGSDLTLGQELIDVELCQHFVVALEVVIHLIEPFSLGPPVAKTAELSVDKLLRATLPGRLACPTT